MKWRMFLRLLAVCFCLLGARVYAAPRIKCQMPVFDFGNRSGGDVTHSFTIENDGASDLIIGNLRACCGGSMSVGSKTIPPGSNTQATVRLSLNGRSGRQNKSFYVASNDPQRPYLQLRFVGNVVVPAQIAPRVLHFEKLQKDAIVEKQIQLSVSEDIRLQITNIVSSLQELETSAERAADGSSYDISVRTAPPLPVGRTRGTIKLYTDYSLRPVFNIIVSLTVVEGVTAVPEEILLSGGRQAVTRYVSVQSIDETPFVISSIEVPDARIEYSIVQLKTGAYRCEFRNVPPSPALDGKAVIIHTDHPTTEVVTLPIRVASASLPEHQQNEASVKATKKPRSFSPVIIDYFYEEGCPVCRKVRDDVLPQLEKRFAGRFQLNRYDVGEREAVEKLFAYQEKLGIKEDASVCMIIDYTFALNGFTSIKEGLLHKVDERILARMDDDWVAPTPIEVSVDGSNALKIAKQRSLGFSLGMVAVAGLADGINPCAIASLVFLMSMMRLSRNAGKKLFVLGVSYCVAAFLTYIAIGFGLLRAMHMLAPFEIIQRGIEWLMLCVLVVLAALSFHDAYQYKHKGHSRDVSLQLPKRLKRLIHAVMRRGLQNRSLVLGGCVIGVIVTAVETVCTGQVLVPTLVLIIRESGNPVREIVYLLLYNTMFILPLVAVFILTYSGLTTEALIRWSQKHFVISKYILGIFFISMFVLLLFL